MDISALSTQISLPVLHEKSTLSNARDDDSLYLQWKKLSEVIKVLNLNSQVTSQLARDMQSINKRSVIDLELFPFKIYNVPDIFRNTVDDDGDFVNEYNWRTFRVRGGLVANVAVSTGSFVAGTDNFQNFSDYNFISESFTITDYDYIVDEGIPQYWFWIEQNGNPTGSLTGHSPYFLRSAVNPTVSGPYNPNPWMSFPLNNTSSNTQAYYPIGYVDTSTSASQQRAFIRQLQRTDVVSSGGATGSNALSPSGMNYRGSYSPTTVYLYGDVVRVQAGSGQGVWVNVSTGSFNVRPVFPEPVITGGTNTWDMITFGVQAYSDCSAGVNVTVFSNQSTV